MRVSLLIIVAFLCVYTTWIQKTAREVITTTTAREEQLRARLGNSERARILAEKGLAAARRELEALSRKSNSSTEEPSSPASGTAYHHQ